MATPRPDPDRRPFLKGNTGMLLSFTRRRKAGAIEGRLGLGLAVMAAMLAWPHPAFASAASPGGRRTIPEFKRAGFHRSTTIDNRRIPLLPGTELVLKGQVAGGQAASTPHSLVIIVTDLTKVIDGVRTV